MAATEILERGPAPAAFLAVATLLERYEASAVAAALWELWDQGKTVGAAAAPPAASAGTAAKLWIGIGKRDAVTPHDLVAALVKDAGVAKEFVGKVEIRESFTLVELGAGADPEAVAERLTGKSIRKRRVVARLDRGRQ
jgi:ATP-dependent RNA helicase DeaD